MDVLFPGWRESVRRGWRVRVSPLCWGLRVLWGRFTVCGILELVDENCYPHPGMLRHRLSARCRPFHLEVWQSEGKESKCFSTNQILSYALNILQRQFSTVSEGRIMKFYNIVEILITYWFQVLIDGISIQRNTVSEKGYGC